MCPNPERTNVYGHRLSEFRDPLLLRLRPLNALWYRASLLQLLPRLLCLRLLLLFLLPAFLFLRFPRVFRLWFKRTKS